MGDIKYIVPGLSRAIAKVCVDRIAEFANDREDGVAPSGKNTNVPRQEIQEAARHLFQKIQRQCIPFGSLRLFSGDSSQMDMYDVDDVALYLQQELGFDVSADDFVFFFTPDRTLEAVAKNIQSPAFRDFITQQDELYPLSAGWETRKFSTVYEVFEDPEVRQIVLSDNFAAFAIRLKEAFNTDVFLDIDKALGIYRQPREMAAIASDEVKAVFENLDEIFRFDSLYPGSLDPLYLEALSQRPDLKEHLGSLQTLYKRLHKNYGDGFVVDTIKEVKSLTMIAADEEKVEALLSPGVKQVYTFLVEEVVEGVYMLGDGWRRECLLELASKPKFLTALRDLHARFGRDFLRPLYNLPGLVDVAFHPSADRILAIAAKRDKCMSFVRGLEDVAESPAGLDAVEVLVERFPQVNFSLSSPFGCHEIDALSDPHIASLISSGKAEDIYHLLQPHLGRRKVNLSDFLDLLRMPLSLEVLLDEAFMEQCQEAVRLISQGDNFDDQFIKFIKWAPDDVSRFLSPDCREAIGILHQWGAHQSFEADNFLNLMDNELLPMLRLVEGMGIIGEGKLISKANFHRIDDIVHDPIKSKLKKKNIRDALSRIAATGCFVNFYCLYSFGELLSIAEIPGADRMLRNIKSILGRRIKKVELFQLSRLLNDGTLRKLFVDSGFLDFCQHVRGEFLSPQTLALSDLKELAVVYPRRAICYNKRFKELLRLVKRDFGINGFRVDMLSPLMQLAKSLNFEKIAAIKRTLGRSFHTNDLFILNAVAHDPALEKLLMDRDALHREAREIYRHGALPRRKLKFNSALYTERPPLEEIDSLSLLRLVLLRRALQNKGVRKKIGRIVSDDLGYDRAEYGGTITWDGRSLHFNNVKSTSFYNGGYSNELSDFLQGGLMSFHLHATIEDDSPYAGPSGDPWGGARGDWAGARLYGVTDVVVTTAGLVKGSPGMIRVNLDMYYVDDKGRPFVIDLGVHEVPYTPPKPKPSRKSSSGAKSR